MQPNDPPEVLSKAYEWLRTRHTSTWEGDTLSMVCVEQPNADTRWMWTAFGWRCPDEADGANSEGWKSEVSRSVAEVEALKWYLGKDE